MTCEPTSRKPSNQVSSNPCSRAQKSRCKEHPSRPPPVSGTPKKQRPRKQALPMLRFPGLSPAPASATGLSQGHPCPGSPKSFQEQLTRRSGGLRIRRAAASERRGKPGKTLASSDSDSFRGGRKVGIARGWATSEWPFVGWESIATGFRCPHVTITGNGTAAVDANALRIRSQSQSQLFSF